MARVSDPVKTAAWTRVIQRFESSGLSQREFCEREGIAISTFGYWWRKLGGRAEPEARFIPLEFLGSSGSSEPERSGVSLVVELPGGVTLRFSGLVR